MFEIILKHQKIDLSVLAETVKPERADLPYAILSPRNPSMPRRALRKPEEQMKSRRDIVRSPTHVSLESLFQSEMR